MTRKMVWPAQRRFAVLLKTTNAAFHDDNRHAEVARILRHIADQVERGAGACMDVNGNRVGSWGYES